MTSAAAARPRRPRRKNKPAVKKRDRRQAPLVVQWLQFAALCAAEGITRLLPVSILYAIGSGLGRIAYALDARHRRVAYRNLELAYGEELDRADRRRIVIEAFRSMVLVAFDVLTVPRLLRPETVSRWVEFDSFADADEAKRESNKLIYVTAHYGSWEVLGAGAGVVGHPFHAVARPMRNRFINEKLVRARESLGQKIISKYGVMGELIRRLRAGDSLGFVADQDARHHGIFVDFFGQPSSTIPSPALLAYRFGLPLVVGHARRVGRTFRFRVGIDAVIRPDPSKPREEEVRRMTQEMSHAFEAMIRKEPGQYLWLHRRWKTRPESEEGVYS